MKIKIHISTLNSKQVKICEDLNRKYIFKAEIQPTYLYLMPNRKRYVTVRYLGHCEQELKDIIKDIRESLSEDTVGRNKVQYSTLMATLKYN